MAGSSKKKKGHGPHHGLALTLCSVMVIAGVLFLQMAARKLKRWSEGQKHASDVLEASERELTVLGLIAFGLFILEASKVGKGGWYAVFHEVHFALFTIAIVYMSVNALLYGLSRRFAKRWRAFESSDKINHRGIVKRFHNVRKKLSIRPLDNHLFFGTFWLRGLCRHPLTWLEYQKYLEQMTFHEIRRDFLRSQHLPHDFDFTVYLESCIQHVCLEFTEIRDSVWVLGILGLVLHQFIATLTARPTVSNVLVGLSVGIIALILIVFLKVKWIYWYVLHSEMLYSPGTEIEEQLDISSTGKNYVHTLVSSIRQRDSLDGIQRSLFWFDNPGLVVTMLEACLFAVSGNAAILLFRLDRLAKRNELAAPVAALVAAVAALFFLLPKIVPRFTLITHIGEMTDPRRLAQAVTKQQQRGRLGYEKTMSLRSRNNNLSDMDISNNGNCGCTESWYDHPFYTNCLTTALWHHFVEAPGLSSISAVFVVAYSFAVVITLNEAGARAVIGHGGVVTVRSIEVSLSGLFLIEAALRFAHAPKMLDRKLDLILVSICTVCDVTSFALFLATTNEDIRKLVVTLHALSTLIILRIVNTAWHEELREVRLEHIRLNLEKTAELDRSNHIPQYHSGPSRRGSAASSIVSVSGNNAQPQPRRLSSRSSIFTNSSTAARKRRVSHVFGPNNTARSLFIAASTSSNILNEGDGDEKEEATMITTTATPTHTRRPSETPAWLTFYEPPGSNVIKSDERHPMLKAAEVKVHDLVVAVIDELSRDPDAYAQTQGFDDADRLARKALELSLQRHDAFKATAHELGARSTVTFATASAKPGHFRMLADGATNTSYRELSSLMRDESNASQSNLHAISSATSISGHHSDIESATPSQHHSNHPYAYESENILPPPSGLTSRVTSTQVEELEDLLYFNHVVLHTLVTLAKGKKKHRKSIGSVVVDDLWHTVAQPVLQRAASLSGHRDMAVGSKASLGRESSIRDIVEPSLEWKRCRLVLTRDALYYYRTESQMSVLTHGNIEHLDVSTAEPATLALDSLECHQPEGKLHINTILKISTKPPNGLICTTTTSSFFFDFDHSDHPRLWKVAIEDAVDREDDDDPLHPLGDDAVSLASVDSFLHLHVYDHETCAIENDDDSEPKDIS
mmetsp:Transcript_923/g.1156  ORF Transcript_923/g.1156 Transcript_923/m.1156 type:complete len:1141 (-) Transcript_923:940-4362(-)